MWPFYKRDVESPVLSENDKKRALERVAPPPGEDEVVPKTLSGGYFKGEKVYYLGPSKTYSNGDKIEYGNPLDVVGPPRSEEYQGKGLEFSIKGNTTNRNIYLVDVSREIPGPLPGGYQLGEDVYYIGPAKKRSDGQGLTYGQKVEVVGPARSQGYSGKGILCQAPGNKAIDIIWLTECSRKPPAPLPGGFEVGEELYYVGPCKTYSNGDKLMYGQKCEVICPARSKAYHGKGLEVYIKGAKYTHNVHASECHRGKPDALPGGYKCGEQLYYLGPSRTYSNGDSLKYGQRYEVVGPARSEGYVGKGVEVQGPGNKYKDTVLVSDLSPEPPAALPGGYSVGEQLYYLGPSKTYPNGDQITHGQLCTVAGPASAKAYAGKGLEVSFPDNRHNHNFFVTNLSREPPEPLPGGYSLNEKVYYLGASKTFSNGERIAYGQPIEVVGPARSEAYSGKGIEFYVPGNQINRNFFLTDVSREAPGELPGGYQLDAKVYYVGPTKTYSNGDVLKYGTEVEVRGPAAAEGYDGQGLDVSVPNHDGLDSIYLTDLSTETPEPLPGGYEVGDQLYYLGPLKVYSNGDKIGYGVQCEVVGPARAEGYYGKGVQVRVANNKFNSNFYLTHLSREAPGPLPGGYKLSDNLYFTGPSKVYSSGEKLKYGQQVQVAGPATAEGYVGKGLEVFVEGHKYNHDLSTENLSYDVPDPIPGGYEALQQIYYIGYSRTFSNGERIFFGRKCEVIGPCRDKKLKDKSVEVKFAGNKYNRNINLEDLTTEAPPELPGGHQVGDQLYYCGEEKRYPDGDKCTRGAKCPRGLWESLAMASRSTSRATSTTTTSSPKTSPASRFSSGRGLGLGGLSPRARGRWRADSRARRRV